MVAGPVLRGHGPSQPTAVVLVEGESDAAAVSALAARLGVDLAPTAIEVIGGAHAVRRHLSRLDASTRVAVLCDAGEAGGARRALAAAGRGVDALFVCDADLEDELIRALGTDAVLAVLAAQGALHSFRTMQKQPAQRDRPVDAQLRRFFGARSGHKTRYARLLVDALDPVTAAPRPLLELLAFTAS